MSRDAMTGQCRQKRFRDSTQPSAAAQDSPGKANHATSFLMICRRSEMGWYPLASKTQIKSDKCISEGQTDGVGTFLTSFNIVTW